MNTLVWQNPSIKQSFRLDDQLSDFALLNVQVPTARGRMPDTDEGPSIINFLSEKKACIIYAKYFVNIPERVSL